MSVGQLGTITPVVNTETVAYLCPTNYKATGTLVICNTSTSGALFRVGISPTNIALVTSNYLEYDRYLAAGESFQLAGLALTAGQSVRVKSDTANVAFNFIGMEALLP